MTDNLSKQRLHRLLHRAKRASVTDQELDEVAAAVHDAHPELYTLLHILGRCGRPADEEIVARYTGFVPDAQIAALALGLVCSQWGRCRAYRETIRSYLRSVSWDHDDDLRLKSISVAGECLRDEFDEETVRELLNIFSTSRDPLIRNAAYSALMRAFGKPYSDIPNALDRTLRDDELDKPALEELQRRSQETQTHH